MLVASQQIEFLGVLEYGDTPIEVELWIGKLGGSSLELHTEIVDLAAHERRVVARAITTVVIVDGEALKPIRLTPEARAAVEPWMDAPLQMRRA